MRMNNLTARLRVNELLVQNGHEPISAILPYTGFATRLRQITAPTVIKSDAIFASREDAVAYIRLVACGGVRIPIVVNGLTSGS